MEDAEGKEEALCVEAMVASPAKVTLALVLKLVVELPVVVPLVDMLHAILLEMFELEVGEGVTEKLPHLTVSVAVEEMEEVGEGVETFTDRVGEAVAVIHAEAEEDRVVVRGGEGLEEDD